MPRPRNSFPKYSVDATGRAFTKVHGRFVSLGRAEDPQAQVRYAEVLQKHAAGEPISPPAKSPQVGAGATINILLLRFCTEELPRYSAAEQFCLKGAFRILRQLFGDTPTAEFGPLKLRAIRDAMVKGAPTFKDSEGNAAPRKPWSRGFVNKEVKRLRLLFRWGVSWELVPQSVADALTSVTALKPGETDAADYRPRRAVPDNVVLSEMTAGDRIAAAAINLTAGTALYAFKIGWDIALADASPGVVHETELLLESQKRLNEFTIFDSCATETSYIAPLWPERIPVATGVICASRLSRWSQRLLNAGRKAKLSVSWW